MKRRTQNGRYFIIDDYCMDFSPSQIFAIDTFVALMFSVMYLLGPPGYGKTTVVREGVRRIKEQYPNKKICITAMTSVAAEVIGNIEGIPATTFCGWWEIGKASIRLYDETFLRKILTQKQPQNPLTTDILIIDESSMLSIEVWTVMDRVLRWYRGNRNQRFGGIQIILIGDCGQLQPMPFPDGPGMLRENQNPTDSCLNLYDTDGRAKYCVLKEPHRNRNHAFQKMIRGFIHQDPQVRKASMIELVKKHYREGLALPSQIVRWALKNKSIICAISNKMVGVFNEEVKRVLESEGKRRFVIPQPYRMFTETDIISIPLDDPTIDARAEIDREEREIVEVRKRFCLDGIMFEGQTVQMRASFDTNNGVAVRVGDMCTFVEMKDGCCVLVRKSDEKELIVGEHQASSEFWDEFKWSGYPFISSDASTPNLLQGCTIHGNLIFYSHIEWDVGGNLGFILNVVASRVTDQNNLVITYKMDPYALASADIQKKLTEMWSLEYMSQYPAD